VAAFWAIERICHNKITAWFGSTRMVAGDGFDRKGQYGFTCSTATSRVPGGHRAYGDGTAPECGP
jgi:hypothetical protein